MAEKKSIPSRKARNRGPVQKRARAKPSAGDKPRAASVRPASDTNARKPEFPVVGLGASAGGLGALKGFLSAMPADSGMAFVVIQHLDPKHESLMAELLANQTAMSVAIAEDGMSVDPDHVYVIPPRVYLAIRDRKLRLSEPGERHGKRMPLDFFFRSLAEDRREMAIGIVLSGTGTDGTLGVKAIKEEGGIVVAQTPEEADYDGMPRSAMATGAVDYVLPVGDMPEALIEYAAQPYVTRARKPAVLGERARSQLADILALVKVRTPFDFQFYKKGTLLRRIERRMGINHVSDSAQYVALLRQNPAEVEQLCKDLLIGVTSFFRDADAFKVLAEKVIPELVKRHDPHKPFRAWVTGCATGEEAYSIVILLIEQLSVQKKNSKIVVFASDIDEDALEVGRAGIYPESIEADVSPERLSRFFEKEDHSYRVAEELRECVIFAAQNLLGDAPFSKLDLVSCRNLLIYIEPDVQEKLLTLFHFALQDGGIMFLGPSESPGSKGDIFEAVSKKHRIYRRIGRSRRADVEFPIAHSERMRRPPVGPGQPPRGRGLNLAELIQRSLLAHYGPASVLINQKCEGLHYFGPIDDYLRVPGGDANQDVLAMARKGLRRSLRGTIQQAIRNEQKTVATDVHARRNGSTYPVAITVHPLEAEGERLLLVTFQDKPVPEPDIRTVAGTATANEGIVQQLEQELEATKKDLEGTIKELEIANEELKAVNEEAMSVNEEFQSTNEELETSKEELQSLNEELTTVNTQLKEKLGELRKANDDLSNLISGIDMPMLFLDRKLNIERYTPATTSLFNIIRTDVGRPISDITRKFSDPGLLKDAKRVLADLAPATREIESEGGEWHNRRILPYLTQDNKIDGVIITFANISVIKRAGQEIQAAQVLAQNTVETVREPLLVLDSELRIVSANRAFYQAFKVTPEETERQCLYDIGNGQWDISALRQHLDQVLSHETIIEGIEIEHDFPGIGRRAMLLNARRIVGNKSNEKSILLALEDTTDRRNAEEALRESEARYRAIVEDQTELICRFNPDTTLTFVNDAYCRYFDMKREELLGLPYIDLIPSEERQDLLRHLSSLGKKQPIVTQEHRVLAPDGSIRWQHWTDRAIFDDTGRVREFQSVGTDITERRKAMEALSESEAQLRSILDTAPEGIIAIDAEGIIQSFSPGSESLFGYTAAEAIGRKVNILMPSPYREEHDRYIARYLETGERRIIGIGRELTGRRKDGSTFPIELAVGEVDPDGERLFTGFVRDLTARHRLEQELRQAQRMEAVGQLTGGVAHDFNNLLTVIIGNLEMLESQLDGNERHRNLMAQAQEAAALGNQLTDRLLAFARQQPLNVEVVDPNALVFGIRDLLRRTLGEAIKVRTVLADDLWKTLADPGQVENALLNLAINARDAISSGGELKIETENTVLDEDYAASHGDVTPGEYVTLSVTDTGHGMSPEVGARAFEPFFTTKEPGWGTGLGLSMVYGFAKQSGGHVELHSEAGHGTTVKLYLPRVREGAVPDERQERPVEEPRGKGETVLVVEDDRLVRAVTVNRLVELGYRVIEADSGQAGLETLARTPKVDLLFTDVVMPGAMTGQDLADEARRRRKGIKVLLTSGYPKSLRGGGDASGEAGNLLRKPYKKADLARRVRDAIDF